MDLVNVAHNDLDGVSSITIDKPTGTANDDIMFALLMRAATVDPTVVPTGWTLVAARTVLASIRVFLYRRVASSEGASYTWEWAATARTGGSIGAYRGGFDTSSPIDVVSDTLYTTSDTTVRAASMTVSATNSPIVVFASFFTASSVTFTPPSAPTTMTEDADQWNSASRHAREFARIAAWTGSGATGDMDVTASASTNLKHAFAVALNPSAGAPAARVPYLVGQGGRM